MASTSSSLMMMMRSAAAAATVAISKHAAAYSSRGKVAASSERRLIDLARVLCIGGAGGDGCESHANVAGRSRKLARDGGKGGDGGDVRIVASSRDSDVRDLSGITRLQRGGRGGGGQSSCMNGARGVDCVIHVPAGTAVFRRIRRAFRSVEDDNTGMSSSTGNDDTATASYNRHESNNWSDAGVDVDTESSDVDDALDVDVDDEDEDEDVDGFEEEQVAELMHAGESFVAARGGRGGRGNAVNGRAGATPGLPGDEIEYMLELRLMADVGLVGMPNVGKSSLLRAVTAAEPRVANYPFSTRRPALGRLKRVSASASASRDRNRGSVVRGGGRQERLASLVERARLSALPPVIVADLPGLIVGASTGKGLGHRFLRHAYHCRVFAIVVDASGGLQRADDDDNDASIAESPWEQLDAMCKELELYRASRDTGGAREGGEEGPDVSFSAFPSSAESSSGICSPWSSPQVVVVANKVDVEGARRNVDELRARTALPVLAVSATMGEGLDAFVSALHSRVV